jgi:hypothetical protein
MTDRDRTTSLPPPPPAPPRKSHRRRVLRGLAATLALLVVLAALAPTLLSFGLLQGTIVGAVGHKLGLEIRVDGLSLS